VAFDDAPISSPDGVSKAVADPQSEPLSRRKATGFHEANT